MKNTVLLFIYDNISKSLATLGIAFLIGVIILLVYFQKKIFQHRFLKYAILHPPINGDWKQKTEAMLHKPDKHTWVNIDELLSWQLQEICRDFLSFKIKSLVLVISSTNQPTLSILKELEKRFEDINTLEEQDLLDHRLIVLCQDIDETDILANLQREGFIRKLKIKKI